MQHHGNSQESQAYQHEREKLFQQVELEKHKRKRKFLWISGTIILILLLAVGGYASWYFFMPGTYDNFAQCLTEKGAIMYGAIKWCKYTQAQANMFGKSFKYINYHDERELPGLKTRPTWVVNGKWYEKVQSFDTLAAATECSYE